MSFLLKIEFRRLYQSLIIQRDNMKTNYRFTGLEMSTTGTNLKLKQLKQHKKPGKTKNSDVIDFDTFRIGNDVFPYTEFQKFFPTSMALHS